MSFCWFCHAAAHLSFLLFLQHEVLNIVSGQVNVSSPKVDEVLMYTMNNDRVTLAFFFMKLMVSYHTIFSKNSKMNAVISLFHCDMIRYLHNVNAVPLMSYTCLTFQWYSKLLENKFSCQSFSLLHCPT